MEVEAEAVDGRLEEAEAEAKEKLTAVPSMKIRTIFDHGMASLPSV